MTSTPVAPPTLRRALLAGAAAATAALGLSALATPSADAAFTLGRCQGSGSVAGQGASFQNGAQAYFKQVFETSNGCGGTPSGPTYRSNGSGNGLAAVGAGGGDSTILCASGAPVPCTLDGRGRLPVGQRDLNVAYSATDEPPSPTQQQAINTGGPSTADDGLIHVIPVATGASTLIVHAPEGCDLSAVVNQTNGRSNTVGNVDTGDNEASKTERIRLTSALVEKAFSATADADTWGEIAPGIRGVPTSTQETNDGITDCVNVPVKRIVRQDNSGTTYAWKAYLNLIKNDRGWLTTYNPAPNTVWPAAGGSGTASPTPVRGAVNTDAFCRNSVKLCSGPSSGGGNLADTVNATDGSIGYVDLDTARRKGFDITPSASTQDYTFWIPLESDPARGATGTYAEPTFDALAHSGATGSKGANCQSATVSNAPTPASSPSNDPTLGDWSRAFAAGGPQYAACVMTYFLAWDDNAPVYGNTAGEEAEARTVKDYLDTILSGFGQQFANVDYSPLPNSAGSPMLAYAQTGAAAIGWNKSSGGGGGGGGGTGGGGGGGGGQTAPGPAPRAAPSNQFSIPSSSVSTRALAFTVELPGGGTLNVAATAKVGRRTIQVASLTARPSASGRVRVSLTLSRAAKSALARARGGKLSVKVSFTFTPNGGSARTVEKTVTVRAARRGHRRGHRRSARGGRR